MRRTASDRRPTPRDTRVAIALLLLCLAWPAQARHLSPIVFVSLAGGQSDLWVMQGDGSNPVNLTNDKTEDDFAEWSPDGRRIVWTRGGRGPEGELWVMNADGSGKQQLTFDVTADFNASWSPDGSQIAWRTRRDGQSEIYVMNADGTHAHRLTQHPSADYAPDWSPDGTRIAFTSERSGHAAVYTMNTDGSDVQKLTPDFMEAALPGWSPEGGRIVFTDGFCATCGESDIFVMNADGSGLRQITDTSENESAKSWSRDGSSLVGDFAELNPSDHHLFKGDVVVFDVATGARTKLTDTKGIEEGHPDWSQSGRPTAAIELTASAEATPTPGRAGTDLPSASASLRQGSGNASIQYTLPSAGPVRVSIFDVAGREIARLADSWQEAGPHTMAFAAGHAGQVYLYRVEWAGRSVSGKMTFAP
jgi:Tol biopolymer transport system component